MRILANMLGFLRSSHISVITSCKQIGQDHDNCDHMLPLPTIMHMVSTQYTTCVGI